MKTNPIRLRTSSISRQGITRGMASILSMESAEAEITVDAQTDNAPSPLKDKFRTSPAPVDKYLDVQP